MGYSPDGQYDPNAPGAAPYQFDKGPWQSNEERLTGQALSAASAPADLIRNMAPWSSGQPLPDAAAPHQVPWTPRLIFSQLDRASLARLDYSGSAGSYSGTSTPATSWM